MKFNLPIAALSGAIFLSGCALLSSPQLVETSDTRARLVADSLVGDFNAGDGSEKTLFNAVRMQEFRNAVYVEESSTDDLEMALHQWVFQIVPDRETGNWFAQTWRITRPELYEGAWVSTELMNALTMYDLRHHPECDIHLTWAGESFVGERVDTKGDCLALNGGIQELEIFEDRIYMWRAEENDWITLERQ